MKIFIFLLTLIFTLQTSFAQSADGASTEVTNKVSTACTVELNVKGVIGLSNLQRVINAKSKAKKNSCKSILLLMNTPGGSLDSTRKIVTEILNAEVPFLCLVYPSGAHAGSAGAIILQACHINGAMRATNIGAATPINGDGKDIAKDLRQKLLNDTVSWLEGVTKLRKRNEKFSEEIITIAKAVSAEEAHKIGAIDFIGNTKEEFVQFCAGKDVLLKDSKPGVVVVGAITPIAEGLKEKTLDLLADPEMAYMMFMASLGMLYFEITHPGMVAPGVIGAVGLVVSMVALHKLEVQWGALLLILLGLSFLIAEAFVPSFGMLGVGGGVSLVLGSIFLFDQEATGHTIPLSMILPIAILFTVLSLIIARLAFKSRNYKVKTNDSVLLESTGVVVQVKPGAEYWVEVTGERWKAESDDALSVGDKVKIKSKNNLLLKVTKI